MILEIFTFYLGIGLCLAFIGPLSQRLHNALKDADGADLPKWKLCAYMGILALATVALWPLWIFDVFNERRTSTATPPELHDHGCFPEVIYPPSKCLVEWKRAPTDAAGGLATDGGEAASRRD